MRRAAYPFISQLLRPVSVAARARGRCCCWGHNVHFVNSTSDAWSESGPARCSPLIPPLIPLISVSHNFSLFQLVLDKFWDFSCLTFADLCWSGSEPPAPASTSSSPPIHHRVETEDTNMTFCQLICELKEAPASWFYTFCQLVLCVFCWYPLILSCRFLGGSPSAQGTWHPVLSGPHRPPVPS